MDTPRHLADPAPHATRVRRRLLGIPLNELAQASQVTPERLAAVERGDTGQPASVGAPVPPAVA